MSSSPSTLSSTLKQPTIKSAVRNYQQDAFFTAMARYFAQSFTPLRQVESDAFISMLNTYHSQTMRPPTRKQLAKHQQVLAAKSTKAIIDAAACSQAPSSLALDGWTNSSNSKVTNVLLLTKSTPYFLKSFENKYESTTAEWLSEKILPLMHQLTEDGVRISGIVMDNATVNLKLYQLLLLDYPHLIRLPCCAHVLQLCVKKILEIDGIKESISFMELILNTFKRNTSCMQKLRSLQLSSANPYPSQLTCEAAEDVTISDPQNDHSPLQVYSLLRPTDTRWSSSLFAAERILKLKDYIKIIANNSIPQMLEIGNEEMWGKLNNLVQILKPFQISTDVMQSDSANLYAVYRSFRGLLEKLDDLSLLYNFELAHVRRIIASYWKKHVNIDATIMSAIFSFDQTYKSVFTEDEISSAKDWFQKFAVDFLSKYHKSIDPDCRNNFANRIVTQYGKFKLNRQPFHNLTSRIKDATEKIPNSPNGEFDPKDVWGYYSDVADELACCAFAILSLPCSEASVERSFSRQSIVHSKRRNRLSASQIETEMAIIYNCERESKPHQSDHSRVSVAALDSAENEDEFLPIFQIDDVEDAEMSSHNEITPIYLHNDKEAQPNVVDENTAIAANSQSALSIALPSKKRKVSERAVSIIPHDDIQNLKSFAQFFVERHGFSDSIRFTESNTTLVNTAIADWAKMPGKCAPKDTFEEVKRAITKYLGGLKQQAQEPSSSSPFMN
jgi:hypothetical protein